MVLTAGTQRLLPTATLYFDTSSGGTRDGLWADSNGNAAGSSPEDALVQGFLELVERDAVALWWYNRLRLPGVDLDAFDEPWLSGLRDALGRAGRQVWALDLTSDLGIPVMAAVSRGAGDTDTAAPVLYGFGAHPDPRLALRRALTEMVQMLPAAGPAATAPTGRPAGAPGAVTGPRTPGPTSSPTCCPTPRSRPVLPARGGGPDATTTCSPTWRRCAPWSPRTAWRCWCSTRPGRTWGFRR